MGRHLAEDARVMPHPRVAILLDALEVPGESAVLPSRRAGRVECRCRKALSAAQRGGPVGDILPGTEGEIDVSIACRPDPAGAVEAVRQEAWKIDQKRRRT